MIGSAVTIAGVLFSIRHNRLLNYSKFYLQFNNASLHIDRFISKCEMMESILNSIERKHIFLRLSIHDYFDLTKDLENTIKKLNKDIESINKDNFIEDLININENAPLEFYRDLNGLIFIMVNLHNEIIEESKNYFYDLPKKINVGSMNRVPIHIQLKRLNKKYKKMKKKMKFKP